MIAGKGAIGKTRHGRRPRFPNRKSFIHHALHLLLSYLNMKIGKIGVAYNR